MASSKREKELARQRAERQAARKAAQAARRRQRNILLASIAGAALVLGAGAGIAASLSDGGSGESLASDPNPSASASASASAAPAAGECAYEDSPRGVSRQVEKPDPATVEREQPYVVTMDTNRGQIVFETLTAEAPCTVHSLVSLAEQDYFDDSPCHRLTTSGIFVLQCGDPALSGAGGPGYQFADENLEGATYPRGTVAMANAGPGTNGSQFFLVYQDSELPPDYTPFGTLTPESLQVLDAIAAAGATPPDEKRNTAPNQPVQIVDLRAEPKA